MAQKVSGKLKHLCVADARERRVRPIYSVRPTSDEEITRRKLRSLLRLSFSFTIANIFSPNFHPICPWLLQIHAVVKPSCLLKRSCLKSKWGNFVQLSWRWKGLNYARFSLPSSPWLIIWFHSFSYLLIGVFRVKKFWKTQLCRLIFDFASPLHSAFWTNSLRK